MTARVNLITIFLHGPFTSLELVFPIAYIIYISIPALSTISAAVALLRCWAARAALTSHRRSPRPKFNRALVYHMRGHTNY